MTPAQRAQLADLEDLEAQLLCLLPAEAPPETGTTEDLARAAGAWEAWQQVAAVLGVELPYVVPLDDQPIPYALAEPQCPRRAASVAQLKALIGRQKWQRRCP